MLYLRLRDAAEHAQPDPRVHADRVRPHAATRGAAVRVRARLAGVGRRRPPSPSPRSPSQLASRTVVVVAGRANLAESSAPHARRAGTRCSYAVPGADGAAGPHAAATSSAPSQLGLTPAADGLDAGRHPGRAPPTARSTLLVLLGADPLSDCPTPTSPAAASPAPARSSPSTRSSPTRRPTPTSCCRRAAYAEKAGTTTNLEGRVTTVGQKVTPRRHRAPGLDDRRRARRLPRAVDLGVLGRSPTITDAIAADRCRRTDRRHAPRSRATPTALLADARPLVGTPSRSRRATCRRATATTTGWWSTASCTTGPVATAQSPSLAPLAARRVGSTSTRSTSTASASAAARR